MHAVAEHFEFWLDTIQELGDQRCDIAVLFLDYDLTPLKIYPTQLSQAVETVRYVLSETGRSPSEVIIGGDSAGGNLAIATLLHVSHPHPQIDSIELSTPLAGVFSCAPWANFDLNWPSVMNNSYKDMITPNVLRTWSSAYLNNKQSDAWSEPDRAPIEWWRDIKTEWLLILADENEIMVSMIEAFAKKLEVWRNHSLLQC